MAQEASERACDRCRDRRVKCDKRQPSCVRCEKLGKPCPGYDKKRKFVDEGITLRKKYHFDLDQPQDHTTSAVISTELSPACTVARPRSAYAAASTTSSGSGVPKTSKHQGLPKAQIPAGQFGSIDESLFKQTNDFDSTVAGKAAAFPASLLDTTNVLLPEPQAAPPLRESDSLLDESWTEGFYDPQWFDLDIEEYYGKGNNSCGFLPNLPNIVDEVDRDGLILSTEASATPLSTRLGTFSLTDSDFFAPGSQLNTSATIADEREHEVAFLIRHFAESLGPWMDLFDKGRHFSQLVPLKALGDVLLRNAVAAVAAKQLGRVKGKRPFCANQSQRPSALEVVDNPAEIDWFYKAANYYDKAIAFSRQYLQAVSGSLNGPSSPKAQTSLPLANSDALLVAVSIFSLYESLDNFDVGWLQHLVGLNSLLQAISLEQQTTKQIIPALTVGRLASFWNFARADYQAAYTNHQQTFLDTQDLQLWRDCGLEIQADGRMFESIECIKNDPTHCVATAELVAHTLLWLLLRVMNYLASEADESGSERQAHWEGLVKQLDVWHDNLPATYQPCAQIRHPLAVASHRPGGPPLMELFFSIDVCAAALQLYHFARILLLLHQPLNDHRPSRGSRLKAYREVSNEAIKHAHTIIGIALGRPHPAIRVEMLLSLHIAGSCLEEDEERRVVLELLRAIEQDTGCPTESRCNELVKEWGWSMEAQGVA